MFPLCSYAYQTPCKIAYATNGSDANQQRLMGREPTAPRQSSTRKSVDEILERGTGSRELPNVAEILLTDIGGRFPDGSSREGSGCGLAYIYFTLTQVPYLR